MTKICPNCKSANPDAADFCQSCGYKLSTIHKNDVQTTTGKNGGWWNKQSTGGKAAIGIVGICCIGLILIIAIAGFGSPDENSSNINTDYNTDTTTTQTPTEVTIDQLYGSSVSEGTYVKVTGTVIESQGSTLRIENSDYKDILVEETDLIAYEDQTVTVVGTFVGPTTYDTAIGGARTVPTIEDARLV